jgi:TRAP-type C4-dicarboxylate transport system permease small subunit
MTALLRHLHRFLLFLTSGVILTLLVALSWQVFARYVLRNPSTVTEELSRFLLIVLGTTGAAFTFLERKHLALDWLVQRSGPERKATLRELSGVATSLLGTLLIVGGVLLIREKWHLGQTSPVLGLRLVWLYLLVPFCGLVIALSPFHHRGDE